MIQKVKSYFVAAMVYVLCFVPKFVTRVFVEGEIDLLFGHCMVVL